MRGRQYAVHALFDIFPSPSNPFQWKPCQNDPWLQPQVSRYQSGMALLYSPTSSASLRRIETTLRPSANFGKSEDFL